MTPREFFTRLIPEEWNRRLDPEQSPAVAFGLRIRVEGEGGGDFSLVVDGGGVTASEPLESTPLATLCLSVAAWQRLAEAVGPSPMRLLGGIGGNGRFRLTEARLRQLAQLEGSLGLEVTGETPWGVRVHFGAEPVPPEPTATVRIDSEDVRRIQRGDLELPTALFGGKLAIDGDIDVVLKLALALTSPG